MSIEQKEDKVKQEEHEVLLGTFAIIGLYAVAAVLCWLTYAVLTTVVEALS